MDREKGREYGTRMKGLVTQNNLISEDLYKEFDVKRGLRDTNGRGVLAGLTNISEIVSMQKVDGKLLPIDGQLWYRGYEIRQLLNKYSKQRFGYENLAYLLLFGEIPNEKEMEEFVATLGEARTLPTHFTRDVIMKAPTNDIMNSMTKSILTLASYDEGATDTSIENVISQSINLIAEFPMLAVYAYNAYYHYKNEGNMYICRPDPTKSTAENILMMLRPNMEYTETEAQVLDACLMLHMEHGGGNNSTFTTRVVTSSGADTYATIAAAMSSLKGPKHGGANVKVMQMMKDLKENVDDWGDEEKVSDYLSKLLDGEAFDRAKLIYGMGHAVYSVSDPREIVFKEFVTKLAKEKKMDKELMLYESVERNAPKVIADKRKIYKGVSPNVDFYSGFVYQMLGIPEELYTPLFAVARITGWCAHRLEELVGQGKIIRPAYMSVMEEKEGAFMNSEYNHDERLSNDK